MKLYLTSAIGGDVKENGIRMPAPLLPFNGFTYFLKQDWVENAKVLIISASPSDYERNDSILRCLREAFPMSGLSVSYVDICDDRKENLAEMKRSWIISERWMSCCLLADTCRRRMHSFRRLA